VAIGDFSLIEKAIRGRLQIVATYKGHQRQMCPHVLGWKDGRLQCLFYQFAGWSRTGLAGFGSPENWRCIPVDDLQSATAVRGPWHTAANYSQMEQCCVDKVVVSV